MMRRCVCGARLASFSHVETYADSPGPCNGALTADVSVADQTLQWSCLKVVAARSMMRGFWSFCSNRKPEFLMTDPSATVEQPREIHPHVDHGMSIGKAAIISVVSAILVLGSTYAVVKGTQSTGVTRLLAVVSLLSLVAMVYGLIELALAVIATSTERRRRAREVTERRKGDRARKPTPH
jgi:hypothetical protein